jgi:peptidoglycan/LPS O-acetylase OafA/YrhL
MASLTKEITNGSSGSEHPTGKNHNFRTDLQGLRAIGVLLVVAYHLWPDRVPGGFIGVDVFFVISGYLMATHLINTHTDSIRSAVVFWSKRVKRLLPVALFVLAAIVVVSRLVAPETQWLDNAYNVLASVFYVENWKLAATSVDYLAMGSAPVPTQHFWSLAVEEQFYIFLPFLMIFIYWIAKKTRRNILSVALSGFGLVFLASFIFGIWQTINQPEIAYFATQTRIWELMLGGLVAVFLMYRPKPMGTDLAVLLSWLGTAMIFVAAAIFSGATAFPGYMALLPVVGAALVVLANTSDSRSADRAFRLKPMQWVGDRSYSIYLWHWPIIILAPYVLQAQLTTVGKVAVIALSLVLAAFSKRFIEDPFRFNVRFQTPRAAYQMGVVFMLIVAILGWAQVAEVNVNKVASQAQTQQNIVNDGDCFGAGAIRVGLDRCQNAAFADLTPPVISAVNDIPDAYRDRCIASPNFTNFKSCTYGSGPTKVALVGNSHATQWLSALQAVAKTQNLQIKTFVISSCQATDAHLNFPVKSESDNCYAFGQWVLRQIKSGGFSLVVTSESQGSSILPPMAAAIAGYSTYLTKFTRGGTKVLVIKDPVPPGYSIGGVPDCLASHKTDFAACQWSLDDPSYRDPQYDAAVALGSTSISTLNLDNMFCPDGTCLPVIGSVVVFRRGGHITDTYVKTLSPEIGAAIRSVLGGN